MKEKMRDKEAKGNLYNYEEYKKNME